MMTPPEETCAVEAESPHPPSIVTRLLGTIATAALADLQAKYEVGCVAHRLRYPAPDEPDDPDRLVNLGTRLGLDASSLRRRARVVETIDPEEFAAITAMRTRRGQPLSWSHLELLATLRSRKRRLEVAQRCADEDLSVRDCTLLLRSSVE
jgi:hypothetical protein